MRRPWMAALCLLIAPVAEGRPYQVSDLLRQESYGQITVDPTGRFAMIERRRRYDSASTYRYDWFVRRLLSRLEVVDLAKPGPAKPLFRQQPDAGYWSGGFSPSGRRLIVFRLQAERLQAGILDMATRKVRWLDFAPDLPIAAPAPVWLDDDRLILIGLPDGHLPELLSAGGKMQDRTVADWSRARAGQSTMHEKGSGRFRNAGLGSRQRSLMVVNASTLRHRVLATGDIRDLSVSADRRHAALLLRGDAAPGMETDAIDPAFEPRVQRLRVVDVETGASTEPCAGCDILPNLLRWSPQGERLVFLGRQPGADWTMGTIRVWDAATRSSVAPLPQGLQPALEIASGSTRLVRAGWAGERLIVRARNGADPRLDWYLVGGRSARNLTASLDVAPPMLLAAGRTGILFVRDNEVWRAGLDGEPLSRAAAGQVASTGLSPFDINALGAREGVNPLPSEAIVTLRDKQGIHVSRIWPDGISRGYALEPVARAVAFADAPLVYSEDVHGVGTLSAVAGGRITLDTINRHLADIDPPRRVRVETIGTDGTRLSHWLFLPAARPAAPRLVVIPYPGRTFSEVKPPDAGLASPAAMVSPMVLVGAGYAVLEPSMPLPTGPGDTFSGIAPLVDAAISAAMRTGLVSDAPAFVLGHSFGGYASMSLAARSSRVAAVVATSGIYDLIAGYGIPDPRSDWADAGASLTMPIGWFEGGQARMGAPPWRALERYVRNSPLFEVERVHVPVLLVHGDLDYVPVVQAERMFLALLRTGKDARFLRYAGEGHSFSSPGNIRDYWRRILEFFAAAERTPTVNRDPNSGPRPQGWRKRR